MSMYICLCIYVYVYISMYICLCIHVYVSHVLQDKCFNKITGWKYVISHRQNQGGIQCNVTER